MRFGAGAGYLPFAFSPTATTFKGSFSFTALSRIALGVRLSCLAIVGISFEDSTKDRSLSSSSGVHKGLRGTILTETAPARPWAAFFFGKELWGFSERPQNA